MIVFKEKKKRFKLTHRLAQLDSCNHCSLQLTIMNSYKIISKFFSSHLDDDHQAEVEEALQCLHSRRREVGIQLHIWNCDVESVYAQHMEPAWEMGTIVALFLRRNYNVAKFGPPTWKAIVEAVEKPAGGTNVAQAERINNEYAGRLSSSW